MESLTVAPHPIKGSSRSHSPSGGGAELTATDDALIRSRVQSPSSLDANQTSNTSRHGTERVFHHVKSHSRDLGQQMSQQQQQSRDLEDSPQKKLMASTTLAPCEYVGTVYSPNVSYSISSTEDYSSPNYKTGPGDGDYSNHGDENDGTNSTPSSRASAAIAHLNTKISRTKELIKMEQIIRDDNVNEYLQLAANADKQQLLRIKAVFEKKNQKSAHSIAQLQKKLETYQKRIQNWEVHGSNSGQGSRPREVLRDMGQGLKNVGGNIRDGITGIGGSVMAAPREFAHLFSRSNRFGSADNIASLASATGPSSEGSRGSDGANTGNEERGSTLPRAANQHGSTSQHKYTPEDASPCSSVTSESCGYQAQDGGSNNMSEAVFSIKPLLNELRERKDEYERLYEKYEALKNLPQEIQFLSNALQEERFRTERLEEQINDLTELHQNEVENLKQALTDVEEKVQYQSEERLRDIHEALDLFQTKITKLEQSGASSGPGHGGDVSGLPPRLLLVKLLNVAITLLQLVLLLVATAAGIAMPFLRTRLRVVCTMLVVILGITILKQWPEVTLLTEHLLQRLRKYLEPPS